MSDNLMLIFWALQIKAFGTLVKGFRIAMDLLIVLQKVDSGSLLIPKVENLPMLSEILKQFEVAVDDDFPHYQVCYM